MATYKVIQDIEAEDKFLGPLTLKQFVFGAAAAIFIYLSVIAVSKNAPFLLAVFLPPAFLGAFLAIPWSKDQSTEIWVLAKLRFYFKPKRRLWNQSGVKELVTVTVPKVVERQLTNNLSQNEVTSRLEALAQTIDSHGWAIKNSGLASSAVDMNFSGLSDRLVMPSILPAPVSDDYDAGENSLSDNFDQMIQTSSDNRLTQSLEKMERIRRGEPLESVQQPETHFMPPAYSTPVVATPSGETGSILPPLPVAKDEQELSALLKNQSRIGDEAYGNLHTIPVSSPAEPPKTKPDAGTREAKTDENQTSSTMTTPSSPAILDLAQNDDLSVATIARQAKKSQELSNGTEVVISLR